MNRCFWEPLYWKIIRKLLEFRIKVQIEIKEVCVCEYKRVKENKKFSA